MRSRSVGQASVLFRSLCVARRTAGSSSRKDCYSYSQRVHCHVPFMEAVEAKARRRHVPLSQI